MLLLIQQCLVNRGYNEIITYSFISSKMNKLINPNKKYINITNPININLNSMRTSLWPGLINTLKYNQSRQHKNIKFFEIGLQFNYDYTNKKLHEEKILAGICCGHVFPEQWGIKKNHIDFFDVKNDIETLCLLSNKDNNVFFKNVKDNNTILNKNEMSSIFINEKNIGIFGSLHPEIASKLSIKEKTFIFELHFNELINKKTTEFNKISILPSIRRDLSILLHETININQVTELINLYIKNIISEIIIFNIYRNKDIKKDHKILSLGIIFNNPMDTLTDKFVNLQIEIILSKLKAHLNAILKI